LDLESNVVYSCLQKYPDVPVALVELKVRIKVEAVENLETVSDGCFACEGPALDPHRSLHPLPREVLRTFE
jgi:hypothetical protein